MRSLSLAGAALALGGLLACAGLPAVTAHDAQMAGVPLHELQSGRGRYVAKCSGCHRLYAPSEYDDDAWAYQVDEMVEKAKLTEGDVAAILTYLTALNADASQDAAHLAAE